MDISKNWGYKMSEIILYKTPNKDIKVEILLENETIWLSQQKIAELFDTTKQNISLHVKNIFENGELDENSVVKDFLTTATEGKNKKTMSQKDWIEKLHGFLTMNDRETLQDKGKVTAKLAEQLAIGEYEKYKIEQDQLYVSDFDKLVQKVGKND